MYVSVFLTLELFTQLTALNTSNRYKMLRLLRPSLESASCGKSYPPWIADSCRLADQSLTNHLLARCYVPPQSHKRGSCRWKSWRARKRRQRLMDTFFEVIPPSPSTPSPSLALPLEAESPEAPFHEARVTPEHRPVHVDRQCPAEDLSLGPCRSSCSSSLPRNTVSELPAPTIPGHTVVSGIFWIEPLFFTPTEWDVLCGGRDEPVVVPIGDLYYGPGSVHVNVQEGGVIRKVRPSRSICVRPLAPISTARLDLGAFESLPIPPSPLVRSWWRWLQGRTIAEALKHPVTTSSISRRLDNQDISDMYRWEVMEKGHAKCHLPAFKVPKGDEARLILDCRPLNDALPKPGDMGLPNLHDVLNNLVESQYLARVDARSYFYQFLLDSEARSYFGCRLAARRGKVSHSRFIKLPMGYKMAPGISQHTSNLVQENVDTDAYKTNWVDDFLYGAKSLPEIEDAVAKLQAVALHVGMDLKEPEIGRVLKILGVRIDTQAGTISPTSESIHTLAELASARTYTPRSVFRLMGTALWLVYAISRKPLCLFEAAISVMRAVVPTNLRDWDKVVTLTSAQILALDDVRCAAQDARFDRWGERYDTVRWWSDASDEGIGWVQGRHEWCAATTGMVDIFARELLAGATALVNAERWRQCAKLMIDNTAAFKALIKGLSSSQKGNIILRRLYTSQITQRHECGWVPTGEQLADQPSRLKPFVKSEAPPEPNFTVIRWR